MRTISFLLALGFLISFHPESGSTAENTSASMSLSSDNCQPVDGMTFICGLKNPEDLVRLGKTSWVLASSFQMLNERGKEAGAILYIDIRTHNYAPLFPSGAAGIDWLKSIYPDYSNPPEKFSSHGMDVREIGDGVFRLYAVNHGNRESVEIIDVDTRGDVPVATWRGAVLSPKSIVPNGVAGLPDDAMAISGSGVAVWHPGKGWHEYKNVLARTNGIVASMDGEYLYVNSSEAGTVNVFPVDGEMSEYKVLFDGDFHADNVRWGEGGFLYNAGPSEKEQTITEALKTSVWKLGWGVSRINTATGKSELLMEHKAIPDVFGGATTALEVGNTLWLGTFHGDRIAIIPKP
jgi:hypothetical protein